MQVNSIKMSIDPKLDCYAVLAVSPNDDDVAIRDAFAALAEHYHPHRYSGTHDEAQRKLADLSAAYEVLSDPVRRRRYDLHRRINALTATIDTQKPAAERYIPPATTTEIAPRARPQRSRLPIYALLAAGVLLIVFGIVGYSDRQTQRTAPPPVAPTAAPGTRAVAAPQTPAVGNSPVPLGSSQAAVPLVPDARPPPSRPAVPRNAPPLPRPANSPPADSAPEACTDVQKALGLCRPK